MPYKTFQKEDHNNLEYDIYDTAWFTAMTVHSRIKKFPQRKDCKETHFPSMSNFPLRLFILVKKIISCLTLEECKGRKALGVLKPFLWHKEKPPPLSAKLTWAFSLCVHIRAQAAVWETESDTPTGWALSGITCCCCFMLSPNAQGDYHFLIAVEGISTHMSFMRKI